MGRDGGEMGRGGGEMGRDGGEGGETLTGPVGSTIVDITSVLVHQNILNLDKL